MIFRADAEPFKSVVNREWLNVDGSGTMWVLMQLFEMEVFGGDDDDDCDDHDHDHDQDDRRIIT